MKKQVLFLLVPIMLLAGCTSAPLSSLDPAPSVALEPAVKKMIVMLPVEARPDHGTLRRRHRALPLIPLFLFKHQQVSPDVFPYYRSRKTFRSELGETVAKDLSLSGIVDELSYLPGKSDMPTDPEAFLLKLTLKDARWNRYDTCYGISIFSVFLYLVGVPISYGSANLALDAELVNPQGETIAQKTFTAKTIAIENLYFHPFNSRLQAAYKDISPELRDFILTSVRNGRISD